MIGIRFIFAFIASFFISYFGNFLLILMSDGKKFMDLPNRRKIHNGNIPRSGGIALFLSIIIPTIIAGSISPLIFFASLMVFFLGLVDDAINLDFRSKFTVQFIAATLCVVDGLKIEKLATSFGSLDLGFAGLVLTYLWIIGMTNAINLIDGLDGLAISTVLFSSAFLSFTLNNPLIPLVIVGASFGFLIHNFNPAKIFMGDSGSMFLGFFMSIVVLKYFTDLDGTWIVGMGVFMGYPVLDTTYAFFRRLHERRNPFLPDRKHFHHQLLEKGFSQKGVLFRLILLSVIFNFLGLSLRRVDSVLLFLYVFISGIFYIHVKGLPFKTERRF